MIYEVIWTSRFKKGYKLCNLPDTTEWSALFNAVGRKATAGEMLKSTEGWKNSGNGSDAYFFSALPAGVRVRNSNGDFNCERISAFFWSSTEYGSNYAYPMNLNYTYGNADPNCNAYRNYSYKGNGFSVRCLRD